MIHILSKETIDKIAAGEVAERPQSVVKELLDNAIDAGADAVSVELKGGGLELIRVTDNGCGIPKEDVPAAFIRHATSKLMTAEDIEHIRTMGFRGEALASIAAVSDVELITRTENDLTGILYNIHEGTERNVREIGAPVGTTVVVRDFLQNVPVRRQFLKSAAVENSYMVDTVEKAALSHTGISFSLTVDGRSVLHTSGNGRQKDVIYILFGQEVTANLMEISGETEGIRVTGYAGKPVISRSRRDQEIFFVNGRHIHSDILMKAAEDAFSPYMMQHRFPMTVLDIVLPPEKVDVNVHPRKTEVRFSDGEQVYNAVKAAVSKALSEREHVVDGAAGTRKWQPPTGHAYADNVVSADQLPGKDPLPFEKNRRFDYVSDIVSELQKGSTGSVHLLRDAAVSSPAAGSGKLPANDPDLELHSNRYAEALEEPTDHVVPTADVFLSQDPPADSPVSDEKPEATAKAPDAPVPSGRFMDVKAAPYFKMIGQVFETYWIIEYNSEMYLIDQHAAHEKVNYERFTRLIASHAVTSQMLFPPVVLTLSAREAALLEKNLDAFSELGYEIEGAGDRDYIVRAVPSNLPNIGEEAVLKDMIQSMSEDTKGISSGLLKDKIASMSCKAAVKGNRPLSEQEMKALIAELLQCENPYACPHGRPTIVRWSKADLDRLFKRIV